MSGIGEVEEKINTLCEEVFQRYNPDKKNINEEGQEYILKENLKEFIREIMDKAGESEAWEDADFEDGYKQFDTDGSGKIERTEFMDFIKRYADL